MAEWLRCHMQDVRERALAGVAVARHRIDQAHTSVLMKLSALIHATKKET